MAFIEHLRSEAAREDLPANLRKIADAGARTLSDVLAALRAGDREAAEEIWLGTALPSGRRANDGIKQVLPYWARGVETLEALSGIVVVDEAAQPPTVTVHWERVPPKLRRAAASLASELVDIHYPRPKGGRPRKQKHSAQEPGDPDTGGPPA